MFSYFRWFASSLPPHTAHVCKSMIHHGRKRLWCDGMMHDSFKGFIFNTAFYWCAMCCCAWVEHIFVLLLQVLLFFFFFIFFCTKVPRLTVHFAMLWTVLVRTSLTLRGCLWTRQQVEIKPSSCCHLLEGSLTCLLLSFPTGAPYQAWKANEAINWSHPCA